MNCLSVLGQYVCAGHRGSALALLKEVLRDQPKGLGQMLDKLLREVRESATEAMRRENWDAETVVFAEKILVQTSVSIMQRLDEWSVAKKFRQILDELEKAEAQVTTLLRRFQENTEAEWRHYAGIEREEKFDRLFEVMVVIFLCLFQSFFGLSLLVILGGISFGCKQG